MNKSKEKTQPCLTLLSIFICLFFLFLFLLTSPQVRQQTHWVSSNITKTLLSGQNNKRTEISFLILSYFYLLSCNRNFLIPNPILVISMNFLDESVHIAGQRKRPQCLSRFFRQSSWVLLLPQYENYVVIEELYYLVIRPY